MMDKVSIVIPVLINNRKILQMTINCLSDIIRSYGVETEIIMVDDYSDPSIRSTEIISNMFRMVKVLRNTHNMGFAKTCNKGVRHSNENYICLLNNDIMLPNPSWLKMMTKSLEKYDITAPAFGRLSLPHYEYLPGEAKENSKINKKEFTFAVGWCILFKREVFDAIGGLSEAYGAGFFEDVEFSYKAKQQGFTMGITEGTQVQHLYHTTFKAEGFNLAKEYQEKRKIFLDIIRKDKKYVRFAYR